MENNKEIEDGTVSTEATYVSTEATFTDEHSLHNPTTEQSLHLEQSATRIESQPCGPCMEAATNTNIMAKWFCQDCNEYFCTGCRADHDVLKMAQNHKVCEIVLKCDQCSRKELSSEANWHCTECDEHLCGDCKSVHRKFKATKSHEVLHNDEYVWSEEKQPQDRGRDVEKKQVCKFFTCMRTFVANNRYVFSRESVMSGAICLFLMVICFPLYGGIFCSNPAIPKLDRTSWRIFGILNVTVPGDERSPFTSSVAFLPDGRFLVIDLLNKKLKIFDQQFNFVKERKFMRIPTAIAVYDSSEISVAFPGSIVRYSVQEDIVVKKSMSVEDLAVEYLEYISEDKLAFVTYDATLYLIKTDGEILTSFDSDGHGNLLFDGSMYITADRIRSRVYVTNQEGKSVVAIDLASGNNDVLFTYEHPELRCPADMAVDNEGNLYVCDICSGNIQEIDLNGQYVKSFNIPPTSDWTLFFRQKISLISNGETFIVVTSSIKDNIIMNIGIQR